MPKNLDGARKLSRDEINKNREIVLKYIGEKNSESTKERNLDAGVFPSSIHVDGIKIKAKLSAEFKEKITRDKAALAQAAEKQAEEKAKIEFERKQLAEKEEKLRAKSELEERKNSEKIKRAEEKAKTKEEKAKIKSAKIQAAKKRKIKRKKAAKIFKNKFKNKLNLFFLFFKRIFIYLLLYLIIAFFVFYSVFCVIVLRFKIEGNIITKIERFLPVPAAIANKGIINYHDFLEIKNGNYNNLNLAGKKAVLAEWMVFKKLSVKYGLAADSPKEILAQAFAADEDFNQSALPRIKKISELLKNENDIKQLSKYADEYGESVYSAAEAERRFGQAIFNLKINEASGAFFGDNGYYIAQVFDNKNGELGIKYLFVRAETFDIYMSEQSAQIKMFILAN